MNTAPLLHLNDRLLKMMKRCNLVPEVIERSREEEMHEEECREQYKNNCELIEDIEKSLRKGDLEEAADLMDYEFKQAVERSEELLEN